jgi:hypothetical protein
VETAARSIETQNPTLSIEMHMQANIGVFEIDRGPLPPEVALSIDDRVFDLKC